MTMSYLFIRSHLLQPQKASAAKGVLERNQCERVKKLCTVRCCTSFLPDVDNEPAACCRTQAVHGEQLLRGHSLGAVLLSCPFPHQPCQFVLSQPFHWFLVLCHKKPISVFRLEGDVGAWCLFCWCKEFLWIYCTSWAMLLMGIC